MQKVLWFFRAKLGLPLKDEERGILIQPGVLEERTRIQAFQVPIHTYLRLLHEATGFPIYEHAVKELDEYAISIDGLSRQEHIADRQPKVVQPAPSVTSVSVGSQEHDGKEKKK